MLALKLRILLCLVMAFGLLELVDDHFLLLALRDVLVALSHIIVEQHFLLL